MRLAIRPHNGAPTSAPTPNNDPGEAARRSPRPSPAGDVVGQEQQCAARSPRRRCVGGDERARSGHTGAAGRPWRLPLGAARRPASRRPERRASGRGRRRPAAAQVARARLASAGRSAPDSITPDPDAGEDEAGDAGPRVGRHVRGHGGGAEIITGRGDPGGEPEGARPGRAERDAQPPGEIAASSTAARLRIAARSGRAAERLRQERAVRFYPARFAAPARRPAPRSPSRARPASGSSGG